MKGEDAPALLRRHGIEPGVGAVGLTAALTGRGWSVTVEADASPGPRRGGGGGRWRRGRARRTRRRRTRRSPST